MKTDFEAFKELILNNYDYTEEIKYRFKEQYDDNEDSFSYVYYLYPGFYLKLIYCKYESGEEDICFSNSNYLLDLDKFDRTNYETFKNSIIKNFKLLDIVNNDLELLYNHFLKIKGK